MSLKIYTYSDPYEINREPYWNEIRNCAHFCVSRTMVSGLEEVYHSFKSGCCLTTVRALINSLYSDWEDANTRVRQMMEVDNAIGSLAFDDEGGNVGRSLGYNTGAIVSSIRLLKELGLDPNGFDASSLTADQKCLIEIYKYICKREKTYFEFRRVSDREAVDEGIMKALAFQHEDHAYNDLDTDTVVFHGIHQFSPSILCAIEDISRYKRVILLFNYQQQYKTIYKTWLNIYSLFDEKIVFSRRSEFLPDPSLSESYACNVLADNMGRLADGRFDIKPGVTDDTEIIEFENDTEFADYCAQLFKAAMRVNRRKGSHYPVLYDMEEQLYSASGKVNDILRAYFPQQFGKRRFLDYPIGHFFAAAVEMWDAENGRVIAGDMSLIKDCLGSGLIKENTPRGLLDTFNMIEPMIENETAVDGILTLVNYLREQAGSSDEDLRRIGYLNISKESFDELIAALTDLNEMISGLFSDLGNGGDNFNRFYKRVRALIAERTENMDSLSEEMKKVISDLLAHLDRIDLPDTGTFACLKQTMSFYLDQDDEQLYGANWIVREFEQICGDILRSGTGRQDADKICYHFCCLSDRDICSAKDEGLPWPLDIKFFEYYREPPEHNLRIFLGSKTEFKNFKRYALLYGLEYNRVGCRLSYVKRVDQKDNELYHLIKLLGIKVRKYNNDTFKNDHYTPRSKPFDHVAFPKDNEKVDKLKLNQCPYRFLLESVVQGKTIFRERFHVIFYMGILLQNAVVKKHSGKRLGEEELRRIIIDEYNALDDKFHIFNECEKTQAIAQSVQYLSERLRKCGSLTDLTESDKLKEDFLGAEIMRSEYAAPDIDLDRIVNGEKQRFRPHRSKDCMYCASKDICLYK